MTNHRPVALVAGAQNTLRRVPDGDGVIVEQFVDRNGATWLKTTAASGAVNYVCLNAGATGVTPALVAQGTDTNISIDVAPKGAGRLMVNGDLVPTVNSADVLAAKDLRLPSNRMPFSPASGSVRQLVKDPGAGTMSNVGFAAAPTTDGTITSADSTVRPLLACTTSGSSGAVAGIATASSVVRRTWQPRLRMPFRMGSDVTNVRIWLGFMSADLATVSTPSTQHVAALRFDTSVSDANFQAIVCDGTSSDTIDTGVAVSGDLHAELQVHLDASEAVFYLDDVEVARFSNRLPGSNTAMAVRARVEALVAAAKVVRVGSLAVWME